VNLPLYVWITPGFLAVSVVLALAYAWLMWGPGRHLIPGATPPTPRQALAYYGAVFAFYLALGSPIGVLAMGYLFSAHMLQHVIASLVVAPLLILGLPDWLWRAMLRPRLVGRAFEVITRPWFAIVVFNAVFSVIVFPPFITAMVDSMTVMVIGHLVLVLVAIPMWWPILSPLPEMPRLPEPVQLLYLFVDGIAMTVAFALVTFSGTFLYPVYLHAPRLWGITPMEDQQLGGIIMHLGTGVVYGYVLVRVMLNWARAEEARDKAELRAIAAGRGQVVLLAPRLSRDGSGAERTGRRRRGTQAGQAEEPSRRP
jgi:putative membrane protein